MDAWQIVIHQATAWQRVPAPGEPVTREQGVTARLIPILLRLRRAHESAIIEAYREERPGTNRRQIMLALRGLHRRGKILKGDATSGGGLPVGWWEVLPWLGQP